FLRSSPGKQEILAVPALGGSERRLAEVSSNSGAWVPNPSDLSSRAGPAWSPDGKSLLVVDSAGEGQSDSISLLSLSSRQKRMLTAPPAGQADSSPAFSPDGKSMAFVRASSTGATDVWVKAI